MSGTVAGGIKTREIFYEKYGRDYFKTIGRKGGKACNPYKGFGSSPERAMEAGRIGGKISKRGPAKKKKEENVQEKED